MHRLFSNRRLLLLTIILIVSNLIITGVSLFVIYNKSISSLKSSLIDVVERQRSLVTVLHEQGKSGQEIIQLITTMRERHYGLGKTGEFAIAIQKGDSVIYLLAQSKQSNFKIDKTYKRGLPMRMALQGRMGNIVALDYHGVRVFAAYTYVASLQWGIVAKIPTTEINMQYYQAIGIALVISILLITLSILLFIKISNPLIKKIVENEETYRALFEGINDAVFVSEVLHNGKLGNFIQVNEIACKRLGYTREELLSLTPYEINSEKAKPVVPSLTHEVLDKKHAIVETEHITKNGKVIPVEISTNVTKLKDKTVFYSIARDITERKENEYLLKEKSEEIEAQNEEYKQINDELYSAKEHAEESDRLKTAFLQNMSHEIRTPMNAIMGFADLLTEQYNNKSKLEHYSSIIKQRCVDLLDIINEILDISKIESGQLPIHFEECKLNSLLAEISLFFKENQNRLGKQNIKFNVHAHCDPDKSVIITDVVKLKQIFINLIGNAFKFTEKGSISAGCNFVDNKLVFYVSDTGIGIPLDKQGQIFDRFTQLNHGTNRLYGGTGLGLSIVKGLINLLGGEIWLESEPNKGTTFYFTLSYRISDSVYIEPRTIEQHTNYDFTNKSILIVEDDIYNAEFLKEILVRTGFKIMHTLYGQEAIAIAIANSIDMVLMDISLPDMSGYEATQQIRSHKPKLKIIAQTAYAASEDRKKAADAGCIDYISKPLKRELLLAMINKHLS